MADLFVCDNSDVTLRSGGLLHGNNNRVTGVDCTVEGHGNTIRGERILVIGDRNDVYSSHGHVTGNANTIYGPGNTSAGIPSSVTVMRRPITRAATRDGAPYGLAGLVNSVGVRRRVDGVEERVHAARERAQAARERGAAAAERAHEATMRAHEATMRAHDAAMRAHDATVRNAEAIFANFTGSGTLHINTRPGDFHVSTPVTAVAATTYPPVPAGGEPDAPDGTPDAQLCVICQERLRSTVVVPCGHVYSCVTCMAKARPVVCAMCNAHVEKVIRKFD